jgi:Tfp pilus tip-associated adhesin PilY1
LKPTSKPISKPTSKQIEREIETKIEINKEIFNELFISESWIEINAKNNRTTPDKVKLYLTKFNNNLIAQGEKKNNKREYQSHFARWLPIELAKEVKDKPKFIPLI